MLQTEPIQFVVYKFYSGGIGEQKSARQSFQNDNDTINKSWLIISENDQLIKRAIANRLYSYTAAGFVAAIRV